MTTFILKKYDEKNDQQDKPTEQQISDDAKRDELSITVVGSISEIVAKALQKALAKDVDIREQQDGGGEVPTKAISTEDINSAPLDTFNSIKQNDAVFIHNEHGFKTTQEEWFLTNIGNKTANVFYTLESFIGYIKRELKLP